MLSEASSQAELELMRSPLWSRLLERIEAEIATARPAERPGKQTAKRAAARAHSRLLVALDVGESRPGRDLVSELIAGAVEVILGAAGFAQAVARRHEDPRAEFVDQLRRRLSAH